MKTNRWHTNTLRSPTTKRMPNTPSPGIWKSNNKTLFRFTLLPCCHNRASCSIPFRQFYGQSIKLPTGSSFAQTPPLPSAMPNSCSTSVIKPSWTGLTVANLIQDLQLPLVPARTFTPASTRKICRRSVASAISYERNAVLRNGRVAATSL
ncbi:unnamed protein product [Amoebophrya sp. A120]|nr:unnamed protein product [Amoebophrya sp. A120]|eukprot:GSA120T00016912001.1